MATRDQIHSWVGSTTTDWYGKCAGLTYQTIYYNGGSAPAVYGSATAAYQATRIESTDPAAAPAGAIHYWSYKGTDYRGVYGDWGHVAVDVDGGGVNVLSATKYAHEQWGVHAGLITVASQSSRAGMKYLGWSYTYGAADRISIETPTLASTTTPTPINPTLQEEIMGLFIIVIGTAWYLAIPKTGGGYHAVAQPGDADKYASAGNAAIPVKNFTGANQATLTELRKAVSGL